MTDIRLPEPINEDIYSFGYDRSLNKPIADRSTGVVYDTIDGATNTGSVLSGGNLTLKTLSIGGLVRQVAPGDDIQGAVNAVNREGGGTIQFLAETYDLRSDIEIKSNVILRGAGKDITVLDFGGRNYNIFSTSAQNIGGYDLTIKGAGKTSSQALILTSVDTFVFQNVSISQNAISGIGLVNCVNGSIVNCQSNSNTGSGLVVNGTTTKITFIVSKFDNNTVDGIVWSGGTTMGFVSCSASGNGGDGLDFSTAGTNNQVVASKITGNTGTGVIIGEADGIFVGNVVEGNLVGDWSLGGFGDSVLVANMFGTVTTNGIKYSSVSNLRAFVVDERTVNFATNTSGGGLREGNTVVFKSVASGKEITTTTTNGDSKVFGVAQETIASASTGRITRIGKTDSLFATNGTASLAIGDFLSTYSHAYYAKKATAGEMVFAIALEAPTTSTAQIDALLISPRLI